MGVGACAGACMRVCVCMRERERAVFYSGKTGKHQRRQECVCVCVKERETQREKMCSTLAKKIRKTDHFPATTKSCNAESSQLCVLPRAHANRYAFTQVFAAHTQISGL